MEMLTLEVEKFREDLRANPDRGWTRIDGLRVTEALEFASQAHREQKRVSGEPFIIHPVAVARTLIGLGMDTSTICAALLHDVLEDTHVTPEMLQEKFGEKVTTLVQGVTKIGKLQFTSKADMQAANLRKMLLAMVEDIRVILIKLADRLHNLTTLEYLPPEKQQRIAKETLEIYSPLAHRLGISKIQWELEDLSLRYLHPEVYDELVRQLSEKRQEREDFIQVLVDELKEAVVTHGIQATVTGRPKSFFSIYKKSIKRDKNFSEIYDITGIRVITGSIPECYEVLGVVHEVWTPLQNRFKDYIAIPKSNLYQSLHTTVIHPDGKVFEVQIRTEEMNRIAETGIAAHWAYKGGEGASKEEVHQKLSWLRQLLEWHKDVADTQEFVDGVKLDLFQNQVYVFTPNGRVVELPAGATPLDLAYAIHTEVGHSCVGAHVNGKLVPLTYSLRNGQIVHIVTNKNSKGPSRDWLDVVKSSRARNKIKQWLKKENREEYLTKGKDLLHDEIARRIKGLPGTTLSVNQILKCDDMQKVFKQHGFENVGALYTAVGRGEMHVSSVANAMSILSPPAVEEPAIKTVSPLKTRTVRGVNGVLVAGHGAMEVRLSKCCNPVVGDPIVGYVTRGRGVSVHRTGCPNVEMLRNEPDREVAVSWDSAVLSDKDATFLVEIEVKVHDRPNMLLNVTNTISGYKLNIHAASARVTRASMGMLNFTVEIQSTGQLNNLLDSIRNLPDVLFAYRVEPRRQARHGSN